MNDQQKPLGGSQLPKWFKVAGLFLGPTTTVGAGVDPAKLQRVYLRPVSHPLTVMLFLCALAVAAAIQTILDLSRPFEGVNRVSSQPLRHALDVINHR